MSNLRRLGKTDIEVSPIGLGTWQFSEGVGLNSKFWKVIPDTLRDEIVKTSFDLGINWFDTAEYYGNGKSELGLANSLKKLNVDSPIIATKWWPIFRTARSIKKTFPTRLNNLSPYPIDLHQIHSPYSFSSIKSEMNAMADLLDDGKIRSVGVSNFSANKMRKAYEVLESRGYVLASNQVKYNIMDRKIEQNGVMDLAKELGISIIAYTPLEWGILTGKLHENPKLIDSKPSFRKRYLKMKLKKSSSLIETLTLIAADHNTSVSSVALNWIISFNGDTVVCIPGASASAQVIQNVQAQNISLSKEDLNLIDDVSKKL